MVNVAKALWALSFIEMMGWAFIIYLAIGVIWALFNLCTGDSEGFTVKDGRFIISLKGILTDICMIIFSAFCWLPIILFD